MAAKWAAACMRSGECIKACDYGVNPRFMLAMARVAMAKSQYELPERRRQGVTRFRDLSRDVTILIKTPHIALLALDIMDALGVTYQVMGGPTHCCGIHQLTTGDVEMSGRMGSNSIEKMSHSKSGKVI